jgi:hypothetical protein
MQKNCSRTWHDYQREGSLLTTCPPTLVLELLTSLTMYTELRKHHQFEDYHIFARKHHSKFITLIHRSKQKKEHIWP